MHLDRDSGVTLRHFWVKRSTVMQTYCVGQKQTNHVANLNPWHSFPYCFKQIISISLSPFRKKEDSRQDHSSLRNNPITARRIRHVLRISRILRTRVNIKVIPRIRLAANTIVLEQVANIALVRSKGSASAVRSVKAGDT